MTINGNFRIAKSFFGSILSLMILSLTVLYSYQKIEVLIEKKDVDVLSATKDLVFSDQDKFTYQNGFNIAAAFSEFNNNKEWELDPSYGTLVFNSYEWGIGPDGDVFTERKRLPSHVCTNDELGFERGEETRLGDLDGDGPALFFKVHP